MPDGANALDQMILRHLQDVMFGRKSAKAAANAFRTELQSAVDRVK